MQMRLFYTLLLLTCFKNVYSQTTDSIVLSNAVLYYYSYGTGEPIIILSGGPGLPSKTQSDVAIELSKHYKAILFDQRGTGKSWTKPIDSTTINMDVAINDIDILRKHLNINKLNLYAHSWGSMLAAGYIATFPQHVKLFISVGGGEIDTSLTDVIDENRDARIQFSDTAMLNYW